MLSFFLADGNSPYLIMVGIVIVIAFLEGIGLLIGISISSFLDDMLSIDMDIPDGFLTKILGWMCFGQLPVLIWLVLLFVNFSLSGLVANYVSEILFSALLPLIVSLPIAVFLGVFLSKTIGIKLALVLPKNESSAIKTDSFEGGIATITIGIASVGSPAEASIIDVFQQKHYLMVEPLTTKETFHKGQRVVLIQKAEGHWKATLVDTSFI
ncbi:OB-fold-containig protein [Marinomonas posidonica]|uniref:DUF1449 family protein n=1 Tax=Marinomonas posidonica (strain CECT 7376 / NCIMB 14433 / IVIA-Po-181) TaxID=491952 RepID=F6CWC5_MARPP|nr:OB-fold-containig protein [Marinomonas posidonica]AEF53180.1 protein of unknown function DUF1449 [Marinomonas posidonica IVIA-Po-181]